MKKIDAKTVVKNYRGGRLPVPLFDADGVVATEPIVKPDGKPLLDPAGNAVTKQTEGPATILNILDFMILDFPRDKLTMKHISEGTRLMGAIATCRENDLAELEIEDASYKWLIATMKMDDVGVRMFSMSLGNVLAALGADTG